MRLNLQLFGGRGSNSGGSGGGASGSSSTNTESSSAKSSPAYRSSFDDEREMQMGDVPVAAAMPSENRDDATVESQMIGYASAIGDPVRAMERQRDSVIRQRSEYLEAQSLSASSQGERDAMTSIIREYDQAINRMRRLRENSPKKSMMY